MDLLCGGDQVLREIGNNENVLIILDDENEENVTSLVSTYNKLKKISMYKCLLCLGFIAYQLL